MKGPIGYELSPMAEEASQLIVDSFHPGDVRAKRFLEIIECMDVEIESRGKFIQAMNEILGYDNSDGKHSIPGPHDIAKCWREALDELSKLGNEPLLGNSVGNYIAQRALGVKSNELTSGSAPAPKQDRNGPSDGE